MSLDATAIKQIQEMTGAFIDQIDELPFPAALVPRDMTLESLEAYQQHRYRYRASFATSLVEDFAAYVEHHKGDTCFLDIEDRTAQVIFDLGTPDAPGHCKHKATLKPAITPEFKALCNADGEIKPQRLFIEFLEDWREFWTAVDDEGKDIAQPKAFNALRSMTVENMTKLDSKVDDMSESRTAMESIEAKSAGVQIRRFQFDLTPYEGFAQYRIECRMAFRAQNGLSQGLQVIGMGHLDKRISEEFQNIVEGALPDVTVFKGAHSA